MPSTGERPAQRYTSVKDEEIAASPRAYAFCRWSGRAIVFCLCVFLGFFAGGVSIFVMVQAASAVSWNAPLEFMASALIVGMYVTFALLLVALAIIIFVVRMLMVFLFFSKYNLKHVLGMNFVLCFALSLVVKCTGLLQLVGAMGLLGCVYLFWLFIRSQDPIFGKTSPGFAGRLHSEMRMRRRKERKWAGPQAQAEGGDCAPFSPCLPKSFDERQDAAG